MAASTTSALGMRRIWARSTIRSQTPGRPSLVQADGRQIGDAQSVVLTNGTYMIGNCCTNVQAQLDESTMTWTQVGTGKHDNNSEEGWTLLRNGDILTADVIDAPYSELFNPKTATWSSAGDLPVNLTQATEIGPQTMRPNDTVYVEGANGLTAIYNASTARGRKARTCPPSPASNSTRPMRRRRC